MRADAYQIVSGVSEDRFGGTDNFEDAVRIARSVVLSEGRVEEPVLIEHRGFVIRELVLRPDGAIAEVEITPPM
jgi:hypothetical protein